MQRFLVAHAIIEQHIGVTEIGPGDEALIAGALHRPRTEAFIKGHAAAAIGEEFVLIEQVGLIRQAVEEKPL